MTIVWDFGRSRPRTHTDGQESQSRFLPGTARWVLKNC